MEDLATEHGETPVCSQCAAHKMFAPDMRIASDFDKQNWGWPKDTKIIPEAKPTIKLAEVCVNCKHYKPSEGYDSGVCYLEPPTHGLRPGVDATDFCSHWVKNDAV